MKKDLVYGPSTYLPPVRQSNSSVRGHTSGGDSSCMPYCDGAETGGIRSAYPDCAQDSANADAGDTVPSTSPMSGVLGYTHTAVSQSSRRPTRPESHRGRHSILVILSQPPTGYTRRSFEPTQLRPFICTQLESKYVEGGYPRFQQHADPRKTQNDRRVIPIMISKECKMRN